MKATQQTIQQIQRALRKVAEKFPPTADPVLTDIHLQVKPESGELLAYNDDMDELTRIVVDQWLEPTEEDLYEVAAVALKQSIGGMKETVDAMSVLAHHYEREGVEDAHGIYSFLHPSNALLKGHGSNLVEILLGGL